MARQVPNGQPAYSMDFVCVSHPHPPHPAVCLITEVRTSELPGSISTLKPSNRQLIIASAYSNHPLFWRGVFNGVVR